MRGFGVNQATFGLESCIDDLCDQGGFDCWQFRYDNALTEGGIADQNINVPGDLNGLGNHLLAAIARKGIGLNRGTLPTKSTNFLHSGLQVGATGSVIDDQIRAVFCQFQRATLADAATGASHQCDLAG